MAASKEQDVRLTHAKGPWRVEFLATHGKQEEDFSLASYKAATTIYGAVYESRNIVSFRASSGTMLVEEKFIPIGSRAHPLDFIGCKVFINNSNMYLTRSTEFVNNVVGMPTIGHIMEWHIHGGLTLDLDVGKDNLRYAQRQILSLPHSSGQFPHVSRMRLLVQDIASIGRTDVTDQIAAIMSSSSARPPSVEDDQWTRDTNNADLENGHEQDENVDVDVDVEDQRTDVPTKVEFDAVALESHESEERKFNNGDGSKSTVKYTKLPDHKETLRTEYELRVKGLGEEMKELEEKLKKKREKTTGKKALQAEYEEKLKVLQEG